MNQAPPTIIALGQYIWQRWRPVAAGTGRVDLAVDVAARQVHGSPRAYACLQLKAGEEVAATAASPVRFGQAISSSGFWLQQVPLDLTGVTEIRFGLFVQNISGAEGEEIELELKVAPVPWLGELRAADPDGPTGPAPEKEG